MEQGASESILAVDGAGLVRSEDMPDRFSSSDVHPGTSRSSRPTHAG